ncbi:Succinyl-L-malate -transferase beta subunit [Hyphodiscus hymeniophilus]|uniref:Succinyl-L-malate -transferase beta subunit n=1 Tax=Hyphodiscus hymeniophilus TaxID=353542 RepID=A0A9P6VP53_9HELO|nr:Succinyl-L-malate -transferase beta subunit [Hyphodiscus hymeniophilus]
MQKGAGAIPRASNSENTLESRLNEHSDYDLIGETYQVLNTAILQNPLITPFIPANVDAYASRIKFTGHRSPAIPVPWRFAESIGALKGLEAIMTGNLLTQKYSLPPQRVEINVDHAQLFIMSGWLTSIMVDGVPVKATSRDDEMTKVFPTYDVHGALASPYRMCITNIYRTKDSSYFHVHGSMNPNILLKALYMPSEAEGDFQESSTLYQDRISEYTAAELDSLVSQRTRQAGTICNTVSEYKTSAQGLANADTGLWQTHHHTSTSQPPGWWPSSLSPKPSPARPLAGLKVVDLTRVIAAPAITRGLAELGASIMRITSPHLPDLGFLHPDLAWGKWNCALDFCNNIDLAKAKDLIREADVVVSGYRPGVLDKFGLGEEGILTLTRDRRRGIVFARENCYGWNGPLASRSGWQQLSDACVGISYEFGHAMGNDEPVTPIFPNSDYCTGIVGVCGILDALVRMGKFGGSYTVDLALGYYNQWLVGSVGTYPQSVWQRVWERTGGDVLRHHSQMGQMVPLYIEKLGRSAPYLFDEDFFESREAKAVGVQIRTVKPILRWTDGLVQPGFQVGVRRNGMDKAKWPEDLMTELLD